MITVQKQAVFENTSGKTAIANLQDDGKITIYFYDDYDIMFSVNFINKEKAFNSHIVILMKGLDFSESEICELFAELLDMPFIHVFRRFDKFFKMGVAQNENK